MHLKVNFQVALLSVFSEVSQALFLQLHTLYTIAAYADLLDSNAVWS
jgi:hypothetical protein